MGKMNMPTLHEVVAFLKRGERDFYNVLRISSDKFEDAPFELLMSNEIDVLAGVNKVQMLFNVECFEIFRNILLKYHDNGDIRAVFYGTTSDVDRIIETFEILTGELGNGICNQEKFFSFHDRENVKRASTFLGLANDKDVVHYWRLAEDISIVLQYCQRQEFSLLITISKPKVLDYSIRNKGTIAQLLSLDIYDVLSKTFYSSQAESVINEYDILEYHLKLDRKEFDYFTCLTVSMAATNREGMPRFNMDLYHDGRPNVAKVRTIAEQLISLYGSDSGGSGELKPHEWDKIDNNEYWTGRTWKFNRDHALCNSPEDEIIYYVGMDNMGDDQGFKVSIVSAHKLYELFA